MLILILHFSSSFATSIGTAGGTWSCSLLATSPNNPSGPVTSISLPSGPFNVNWYGPAIWDDDWNNYYGAHTSPAWNCGRQYLFWEYTNQNIAFTFQYGGVISPTSPPVTSHSIKVYCNGTLVHTFASFPDLDAHGDPSVFTLTGPYNSSAGEYTIEYWRDDGGLTTHPDIIGTFVLQPQIQKLWIEAEPICSGTTGDYHFKVHSDPELNNIIQACHPWSSYQGSGTGLCYYVPQLWNFTDIDVSAGATTTSAGLVALTVNNNWISYGLLGATHAINGIGWQTDGPSDLMNYTIPAADIGDYLSGGIYAGTTPFISASFSDGITSMTATAPIIIESPVSTLTSGSASPTPSYALPGMTGTPDASFDMYQCNIIGHDTWTPSNNPITKMHGGGSVNTIRIQHQLQIDQGYELHLDSMTLEMGPGATIVVDHNTNPALFGSSLIVDNSKITAYRGCDVSGPGTDNSTWAGIILDGDASMAQGYSTWHSPQPQIFMNKTELSYADIGIQNGTGSASSGGIVDIVGALGSGQVHFYNNKEHVRLWPYRNIVGGVETQAIEILANCKFENDANAWFPCNDFIYTEGNKNLDLHHWDTFINNTGNIIPYGIQAQDAGVFITEGDFEGFTDAVEANYLTSTNGFWASHSHFKNNRRGISLLGATAPAVAGDTFDVAQYPYTPSTVFSYYPGTDALIVDDQNIGIYLNGTTGYDIFDCKFYTDAASYYSYTTGTLSFSTGPDPNLIRRNTFTGLGTAMLANFSNNIYSLATPPIVTGGLQYLCNTDNNVGYDIASLGGTIFTGGINYNQATSSTGTLYDLPAGNKFGSTAFNIYNEQSPILYKYYSGDPTQSPTLIYGSVTTSSISSEANCYPALALPSARTTSGGSALDYATTLLNINRFLMSKDSVSHRDSLYYWTAQLSTPNGDLLMTDLLIEDNYTDSASAIYDSIISKYSLHESDSAEFAKGKGIIDLLIYDKVHSSAPRTLNADQVSILRSIRDNTHLWAHTRAENWLFLYDGESRIDTLLYPGDSLTNITGTGKALPHNGPFVGQEDKVFPNPVHDELNVLYTTTSKEIVTIQIKDIMGRPMISQQLNRGTNTISTSELLPGIYVYTIFEGTKAAERGKVAKE